MARTLIFLLLSLTACGVPVKVSGQVEVDYVVKLDLLKAYFEDYCKELFPDDPVAQKVCVDKEIADFIHLIEGKK